MMLDSVPLVPRRCPFCGENPILQGSREPGARYVYCENCQACGPTMPRDFAAVALWNAGRFSDDKKPMEGKDNGVSGNSETR